MSQKENFESKDSPNFSELGLKKYLLNRLDALGIKQPTAIQTKSIPPVLSGGDIVGIAQTGTGKTFAFGLPMIQQLITAKTRGLIVLPTRELASQVNQSLLSLGNSFGLKTALLIGGEPARRQLPALRRQPHIIVGTPGRIIDLVKSKTLGLGNVSILVFDEADMMFDMGFMPQIEEIMKNVPKTRQTLLFSATMSPIVMKLAEKHLRTPVRIEVAPAGTTVSSIDQELFLLSRESRWEQMLSLFKIYKTSVLMFVRTKHSASKIAKRLKNDGLAATDIHSNLSFPQRQAALAGFKSGKYRILVATDVAARGLDINDIELVLNYDLPDNCEDYVHRIGRTARAGKRGKAISFVSPDQGREIKKIEKLIRKTLPVKKIDSEEMVLFDKKVSSSRRRNKTFSSSSGSKRNFNRSGAKSKKHNQSGFAKRFKKDSFKK